MATTYRTPGAYVEEITKFPPSVAQVETAIPAFIGYTEKATKKNENDLDRKPTRISSLLEYQNYFGSAYPETTISVDITDVITDDNLVRKVVVNQPREPKPFLMYYSLQMYFANGGGPCYIVSVDRYENENGDENTILFEDLVNGKSLKDGLDLLKSEDEPTLILFPDAKALSEDNFYELYKLALTQCHDMQDRFTIIDTHGSTDSFEDAKIAREGIDSEKDYLKYGAVYYPHLETILDYKYNLDTVFINHYTNVPDALSTAADEINVSSIQPKIDNLITITENPIDVDATNDDFTGSLKDVLSFIARVPVAGPPQVFGFDNIANPEGAAFTVANNNQFTPLLATLVEDLNALILEKEKIKNAANSAKASVEEEPSNTLAVAITAALTPFIGVFEGTDKIESVYAALVDALAKLKAASSTSAIKTNVAIVISELAKLVTLSAPANILLLPDNSLAFLTNVFSLPTPIGTLVATLKSAITSANLIDKNNGAMNGRYLGDITNLDNKSFNDIKAEISNLPLTLPPSSAVAGVYARVDSNRGVWKAPANVGLNYVIKPTIKITNNEQDGLNIDTVAGKSINAIRSFTGKGNLVWGARTLAGNDNEWRYVPVRRFFNMAEESIKKATEQFVFEPNDANTWIRVRAMIENFLILQWRAGALTGAKPEQAFYVRVGLGQTMSADDILNGYMIIEIGMAVVRPAEFIVLQFSHKMAEA